MLPATPSGIGNTTNLPEKIELFIRRFLNPFNPATTINYALPIAANIELSVFNLLGQRVAVLFNAQQFMVNIASVGMREISRLVFILLLWNPKPARCKKPYC
ncbi:MAG: hypothetical protein R3C26_22775 [Calditrichia bacterium]